MTTVLHIPVRRIQPFRKYTILMEGGDKIYLSRDDFSLPGLMGSMRVEMVKVIHCKVGEKLKFSYFIEGKKKAIFESADNVEGIEPESK